jgi:hypothetical protein
MQAIPLDAIPNQSLFVRLDGARYRLTLKEAGGMMAVTIERDGVTLVTGARAVAGFPLLAHPYLQAGAGNFLFVCDGIPYFADFGSTCTLVYASAAEVAGG